MSSRTQPCQTTKRPVRRAGLRLFGLCLALLVASPALAGKKSKKKHAPEPEPVVAAEPAAPAPPAEPMVLPCDWPEGAVYAYSYVRSRTDSSKPELADVKTTTPLTITVTGSGNPARFDYASGDSVVEGPDEAAEAFRAIIGDTVVPIVKLVMTDGTLTGIDNHAEVVEAMVPALKRAMPADADPAVLEQTLAMFNDPTTGTQLLLREPGKLFAVDQELSVPMQFPNPFGGPPLPGHSSLRYVAHDADTLTIQTEDGVDHEAILQALPAVVEKISPGVPFDEAAYQELAKQMPPIDNRMVGTLVYSRVDGFPISVEITQHVGTPDHPLYRSDTWTWTRVEAE